MFLILETLELLKSAIHAVLLDDGFDVPSTPARKATETAKCEPLKQQSVSLRGVTMMKI